MSSVIQERMPMEAGPRSEKGKPTWEVAMLFPEQGAWTESDYFALNTNRFVELNDGVLEVLPMPTLHHQGIALFLYRKLHAFLEAWPQGGRAFVAPVPVRLWPGQVREPDVFVVPDDQLADRQKTPEKIVLAMEVVSEGKENRARDYEEKRSDYARAGIPEYWIVDPAEKKITVLMLEGDAYREHGVFSEESKATSPLLPGFEVPVDDCWSQG